MDYSLERLSSLVLELLRGLLAWHMRNWQAAWISAWHGPRRELRLLGLAIGLAITCVLIPANFRDLGLMGGASYVVAVYLAMSNATFFRITRVGRRYVPLGIVAPLFIQVGVIGSSAIRPLVGDAKEAAMAQDVVGAVVILSVYAALALWFRLWQSGNPY